MEKEKVPRQERGKNRSRATGKNSNGPYAQIVEKAPHAIFVVQEGRLEFANSRAREFLKQPIEKLNPEDLVGLVHPDDRAMVVGHYERRLRGEEVPKVYSFRLVDDRGQTRWVEVSVNLIDWDGRPATLVLAEEINSRKQLELALKEGERTTRALLDASPNVMFLMDRRGKVLAANEPFQRIFGGDGRPVVGVNMAALAYPEEARVNVEKASEVFRTGKPVFFEHEFRGMAVEKSFYPILDDQGRVTKLACYGRVVTEQKQAEQALRESVLRYRLLAENVSDYIWSLDRNLRPTYVSPGVTRLLGFTQDEVLAQNLEDRLTPDSVALIRKVYAREMAKERIDTREPPQPQTLVMEYRRKDGSTFWAETRISPVFDSEGEIVSIVGITHDISDRKKAEEALRESERRYRLLADHATDFIWTMDWNLTLTYASPGITRLLGYTPEEVMAEPLKQTFTPDSWALVKKVYAEELEEEQKNSRDLSRTRTLELEYRCKDGSRVWAESKISAIRDAQGKIVEILGVTRDITEHKRAEEALRGSEEAARRLARENAGMAEITRIISSSLNIDEVYERFAEEMRKVLDFENLTVVTMNIEESLVTITYVAGIPVPGREVGTVIPLVGTSAEEVYRTRSSLFIQKENLAEAVRKMPKLRAAFEAGMQSMIVVPLVSEGRVIGILNFLSTRPDAYTRTDLEIAEKVSAQISGAIANAQLFQELNRTVEALKESELRNRGLVESAGISGLGIVVFQGEKRREVVCVFANQEAQRITGYTEEELRRIPFLQMIHPAHRKTASSRYWTRVQGDQEPVLYQLVIRHKKGHTVLIEISTIRTILHGEESMIGFFRDISERRRTEEALQESEAKFRALVHNAGDMIFLHLLAEDMKPGRFVEVNDLACQKLEYTREELLARSPREIILEYEEVGPSILAQVATAAEGAAGQSRITFEAVLVSRGGNRIPAEISFEAFVLKGQKVGLAIARDITERKRTETELADYRAHLEKMVEERTDRIRQLEQQRGEIEKMAATGVLAARIAHEINNPLAGIKGAFMLIQEAIPPDHRYHHYVGSIHQEINRIARIVRQMFELYRPPEEAREELPIDRMIQDVASLLNPECRDRQVTFDLDLPPAKVRLPAGPVRQVLFNILKNAVEASPLGGRVKVSTQERREGITIQIHDQGPGIPEANRPYVFKPFFTTKVDPQKGLGLGLSISRDIVKNLGGSIRFTSRRGGGTNFQITLPGIEKEEGRSSWPNRRES